MKEDSFVENGAPIPFAEAVTSGLSVGVPGTPATWAMALDRWGSIDLKKALRPAAQLAQRGFVVDETFQQQTAANAARFAAFTSTAELFLPGGAPPEAGSVLRNPDLARTYTLAGQARNGLSLRGAPWRGDRRDGDAAAGRAGLHAQRPARPHAPARPGRLPRPAQGTHADPLPRADRCRDGTAFLRRLDGR